MTRSGTHPASYSMGIKSTPPPNPEVKRQGGDARQSPRTSAEGKTGGLIHPLPHMSSRGQIFLTSVKSLFYFCVHFNLHSYFVSHDYFGQIP
jgi:hypothetical protein